MHTAHYSAVWALQNIVIQEELQGVWVLGTGSVRLDMQPILSLYL